ncbi:hydrolytic protein [Saccharopolyspora sp. NFXS83]|uniref:COG1470 family protein n=1 Tax=Saccharopolyspora sp. NFXS83 TaxID=2993560 RepID=UPI00224A9775|nr:hydrolytic protein [Saccharopolyspora sp. NFXS83]MCX2732768.1 hydrolytic protein [Saccharopolyspora sp. NFXS83]
MSTSAELENTTVVVTPGGEATTTLTVRNGTDIVEAYEFEVVGDCAAWTTVEPARLSLYPGTQGTVTVVLRPPRSATVHAGETPLAVRVRPVERPDLVAVPEMTVRVEPFQQLRAWLAPQRRRAWRTGRFHVVLHNQGNAPIAVPLTASDPAEELRFRVESDRPALEPDDQVEIRLRARVSKLIWFGRPTPKPFLVTASPASALVEEPVHAGISADTVQFDERPEQLDGELLQLPILPRWLLALLALLLALLLLWYTLFLPQVKSAAKEAAENRAQEMAQNGELVPPPEPQPEPPPAPPPAEQPGKQPGEDAGPGLNTAPNGGQFSETIRVVSDGGDSASRVYRVPEGKVLFITDLVLANFQGDEGVLTIYFGERQLTTIALETFRNQDYHWVTPIAVPADARVSGVVNCARPGTPPSGQQADRCVEVLHVNGVLRDLPR